MTKNRIIIDNFLFLLRKNSRNNLFVYRNGSRYFENILTGKKIMKLSLPFAWDLLSEKIGFMA